MFYISKCREVMIYYVSFSYLNIAQIWDEFVSNYNFCPNKRGVKNFYKGKLCRMYIKDKLIPVYQFNILTVLRTCTSQTFNLYS